MSHFDDPQTAELYESAFEQSFMDESKFAKSEIAKGWHDLTEQGLPKFGVAFSPHTTAEVSLDRVAKAIQNAKSSVLFAVMELGGSGPVLTQLKNLPSRKNVFSYGMTQTISGIKIYKPGDSNGMIVPFAYLKGKVPVPFQDEFSGGMGQVIHHKFIVVDFNGENPVVFQDRQILHPEERRQMGTIYSLSTIPRLHRNMQSKRSGLLITIISGQP